MSIASEFKEFIMRGNVIDLAVGMPVSWKPLSRAP